MTTSPQLVRIIRKFMDAAMQRTMRERSQLAKATGLSMPLFGILIQLRYRGNCGISDISERFDISTPAASQLVDKLVQSGLIERTEDPADRRAKKIALTSKGRTIIEKGMSERYRWMDQLVTGLSAKDREKVAEGLMILTETARKLEQTQ
jgi:MarR family transcriptional regulator, organic hydroperoxide resistance regulator